MFHKGLEKEAERIYTAFLTTFDNVRLGHVIKIITFSQDPIFFMNGGCPGVTAASTDCARLASVCYSQC